MITKVCPICERPFQSYPSQKLQRCSKVCAAEAMSRTFRGRRFKPGPYSTDPEVFWSYVEKGSGCWEWQGRRNAKGYGLLGHSQWAHRLAYELVNGPIPPGMQVRHKVCDNPPCCRSEPNGGGHLVLGTNGDNMRDREKHGRANHPRGIQHRRSRLTPEVVQQIRERYAAGGESQEQLARHFGIGQTTVSEVVRRVRW
jgi:hypothetical protein